MTRHWLNAVAAIAMMAVQVPALARAEVPEATYQALKKMGQVVDVSCTAKLYRPLMPKNDYNTWWPPGAAAPDASKAKLYPGVTIVRDAKFGPNTKDVVDIFYGDSGAANRPVFIYVPGGAGNKIEQQNTEANAFYDNIGRWGVKNGFVVVTVQRHPVAQWDDGGRDIAAAVDWVKDNIAKYHGDGARMVMASHSAGTLPTGVYVGHPERWPHGVQIKGMIYMSGAPIPTVLDSGAVGAGNVPSPNQPVVGSTCGADPNQGNSHGAISGPSGATPAGAAYGTGATGVPSASLAPGGAPGGPPPGGPPRPAPLTDAQKAERDNLPGFLKTPVKVMLMRAELDPGVTGDMTALDHAVHDKMCAADGAKAKDGEGHCPLLVYNKRHSHVSEVFAFDSGDTSVSDPILAFAKRWTAAK
ncbi:MAG: alpha/beta hydrolase [Caulobacteraceae bacterium]